MDALVFDAIKGIFKLKSHLFFKSYLKVIFGGTGV
jgi:hypothetical protein